MDARKTSWGIVDERGKREFPTPHRPLPNVRGVIFDVDGVLVDSELVFLTSLQSYLKTQGLEEDFQSLACFLGKPEREISSMVREKYGLTHYTHEQVSEGIYGLAAGYGKLGELEAMPGVLEFLDWLDEQGIPTGIATSGTPDRVSLILGGMGCTHGFEVLATFEDTGVGKPDPAIFNVAAERMEALGVPRGQMIAIEDSPNGIRSARRAGLFTVGFKGSAIVQDTSEANVEVASFAELRTLIDGKRSVPRHRGVDVRGCGREGYPLRPRTKGE